MAKNQNPKSQIDLTHINKSLERIEASLKSKRPSKKTILERLILILLSASGLVIIFFYGYYKDTAKEELQGRIYDIDKLRLATGVLQANLDMLGEAVQRNDTFGFNTSFDHLKGEERSLADLLFKWCNVFLSIKDNGMQMLRVDSANQTDINFHMQDHWFENQKSRLMIWASNVDSLRIIRNEYSLQYLDIYVNVKKVQETETRIRKQLDNENENYQWRFLLGSLLLAVAFIIEKVRFVREPEDGI
ncbi:MAG: hypothetical protein WDO19_16475 [Bacteroidota bacterium]